MDSDTATRVVLCWHMHQPGYQDLKTGEFVFPWVYLHAIKDYSDMAAHLEACPQARAVVNFTPVLLRQLDAYLTQIQDWQRHGSPITDPLLAALAAETLPAAGTASFVAIMQGCLRANGERMIGRFPAYQKLAELADLSLREPEYQPYLSAQLLADLLVWYHLSWMGECVRRSDSRIRALQSKAHGYSHQDRIQLVQLIADTLAGLGSRYRRLSETGQVELAVSPYTHPMLPLLIGFNAAQEAQPDVAMPRATHYPHGGDRARWHLREAIAAFEDFFGCKPVGCWASEGGLSQATLELLAAMGFQWTASGDSVLRNSLAAAGQQIRDDGPLIHAPYRFGDCDLPVFFRDDGLSDLIGFTYASWHADDAVADLITHMENIRQQCKHPKGCTIAIIMDGENAWEYYPDNGYHFLSALYQGLADHPHLKLTTFADCVASAPHYQQLPHLVAGSWIYGSFSTWLGLSDKNRAWDDLCQAKQCFDEVISEGRLGADELAQAYEQLALCEGSDWFWWLGDYNPAAIVSDFEQLFRRHLINLYEILGRQAPSHLHQRLSRGASQEYSHSGTMRRGHASGGEQ
ncbi:MAG: glycoside hydrolase [Marinobacter sp.]|nr:glycoside hydrolase [Marinobacter sp.]